MLCFLFFSCKQALNIVLKKKKKKESNCRHSQQWPINTKCDLWLVSSPLQLLRLTKNKQKKPSDWILCCPQVTASPFSFPQQFQTTNIFSSQVCTSTLLKLPTWYRNRDILSPMKYINKQYITINNFCSLDTTSRDECACVRHVKVNSKNDYHKAFTWLLDQAKNHQLPFPQKKSLFFFSL